ncbi:MAG: MaoC family dehydratase [Alphaproteobacteria bacterium]
MTNTNQNNTAIDKAYAAQTKQIGTEIGVSDWVRIDQNMIDKFADVTMDPQFIHTDPVRAATESPFGGTIAHGFLTLSLASKFVMDTFEDLPGQTMSLNYGFDKIRFLTPVKCDSQIRARFVLNAVTKKSDTQLLKEMAMTIDIKNTDDQISEKPALVATWLWMMVFNT